MSWKAATSGLAAVAALALSAHAHGPQKPPGPGPSASPLIIKEQGDFYVGGKIVHAPATSSEGTDPIPGDVVVDQAYVQYQIPQNKKFDLPVILIHGSWHTGKTYGTTPDGREGWGTYFVRQGFSTYVIDDVNRGRSPFDMRKLAEVRLGLEPPSALPPISARGTADAWTGFRLGPSLGVLNPGSQFPAGTDVALQYFSQLTYMYRNPEQQDKRVAGVVALLDKIGPAILLTHSSTGPIGWAAALARPDLVKSVVSVEPINLGTFTQFNALAKRPILIIRGDFDTAAGVAEADNFVADLRAARGVAKFISLPRIGIRGNSHMMMVERNNLKLADIIIDWIKDNVKKGNGGGHGHGNNPWDKFAFGGH